jgi:aminoglycoside 6'-N-acetyltransferase I
MIRKASKEDIGLIAELMAALWPHHTAAEMAEELTITMESDETAFFVAGKIGFAQCALRHDYVEGTESSPVGYLEGIYVAESGRKQGIARELVRACENWAKEKGCREFASDCVLTNTQSLKFHLGVGFEEANRIICFTKKL